MSTFVRTFLAVVFLLEWSALAQSNLRSGLAARETDVLRSAPSRIAKDPGRLAATPLTSGVPVPFFLPSGTGATAFHGDYGFTIVVPPGATRLTVELTQTTFDVDLAVHYGSDVSLESGQPNGLRADHRVITDFGNERLVITPSSSPPLRPGTYYIAFLVLYNRWPALSGLVTATVEGGTVTPPPSSGSQLTVTVNNSLGAAVPATGDGRVELFSSSGAAVGAPTRTDANRQARFTGLASGSYRYRVYHTAGFFSSTEYWGEQSVTVSGDTESQFQRNQPAVAAWRLFDHETSAPVNSASNVVTGRTLRAELQLIPSAAAATARVRLDRDRQAPYDLEQACPTPASANSCTFTVLEPGTYFLAYLITAGGNTTDTGDWQQAFVAAGGDRITTLGIFNAVSNLPNHVSAGVLASVVATGLAPNLTGCLLPEGSLGPYPAILGSVSVQVQVFAGETLDAPIHSVCRLDGREVVTFQIPSDIRDSRVNVIVRNASASATLPPVTLLRASPGLFEWRLPGGRRQALVLKENGAVVSAGNPLRPGERGRAFVTGMGAMTPPLPTNTFGSSDRPAVPVNNVIVGVNNAGVPVISVAHSTSRIGVVEVVFEVPADAPPGDLPFVVAADVGGELEFSNSSTVAVR